MVLQYSDLIFVFPCFFLALQCRLSDAGIWVVKFGDVSLFKMSFDSGRRVQKIISHEMFNEVTNDNDIALLKLEEPLRFSSKCFAVKFQFNELNHT